MQLGPISRIPCPATDPEQLGLAQGPIRSGLREARRDDDQRADALGRVLTSNGRDRLFGDDDHPKLNRAGDLADRRVGGKPEQLSAGRVDRVDGTPEPGPDKVRDDPASDRPRIPRCSDDSDRVRPQEGLHRRPRRQPVAIFEPPSRLGREGGRELDPDLARAGQAPDREPAVAEDVQHLAVLAEDRRLELLDPGRGRGRRQLAEKDRPQAPSLHLVGDREAHLGPVGADGAVVGMPDDPVVLEGEEAEAAALEPAVDQVSEGGDASEKAEVAGLEGERFVEADQGVPVTPTSSSERRWSS